MCELSYEFIADLLRTNVGDQGRAFFPFVFSLFMFIFFCNLIGLIPYTFTVTSHFAVTFAFAGLIFIGVTVLGFVKNGLGYLKMFYPSGVPIYMAPIIIPIEIISYLSRPVALSVRLMANMLAGHVLVTLTGLGVTGPIDGRYSIYLPSIGPVHPQPLLQPLCTTPAAGVVHQCSQPRVHNPNPVLGHQLD